MSVMSARVDWGCGCLRGCGIHVYNNDVYSISIVYTVCARWQNRQLPTLLLQRNRSGVVIYFDKKKVDQSLPIVIYITFLFIVVH